jgi:hypothetical protein
MKSKLVLIALGAILAAPSFGQTVHSVSLHWSASVTSGVAYNVYRGTASAGPFTKIATDLSGLTYSDTTGIGGTSYYYQVTAVCDATTTCPSGITGESSPLAGGPWTFLAVPVAPQGALTGTVN